MLLKGKTMILKSEANQLEALFMGVLAQYFANPVSGATLLNQSSKIPINPLFH